MVSERQEEQLAFTNRLLFETPGGLRFTQDSPILPNVWLAFALNPRRQQELILTINHQSGTGQAAQKLREMLSNLREKRPKIGDQPRERARVSYIPGQIAVKLYYDEMMRVVLPLTPWYHETYRELRRLEFEWYAEHGDELPAEEGEALARVAHWRAFPQPDPEGRREHDLTAALMLMRSEIDLSANGNSVSSDPEFEQYVREIPPELVWLVRIAGLIGDCFTNGRELLAGEESLSSLINQDFKSRDYDEIETWTERQARMERERLPLDQAREVRAGIVQAFVELYENWCKSEDYPSDKLIWRVTKNRRVHLAVAKSALTVKADAARRLFDISCQNITWAVVDSGIDGAHPAFWDTNAEVSDGETPPSRVVKTLDFTRLRELLDYDIDDPQLAAEVEARKAKVVADIAQRFKTDDISAEKAAGKADKFIERLRERIRDGKDIDWQDLEPAIQIEDPPTPENDHGTHVAGILGADWVENNAAARQLPLAQRPRRMQGVCPDIRLIDVRVFRQDGITDEFELLAAVQFLRWLNSRAGTTKVHGANLSLSLIHEVRRFACGRTPICDECDQASALGMVIVAAAGNRGFSMESTERITASDSYKTVSITDPGNAESVITVGSTHRKRPHEYGVSYFSSRGPTGDGRMKPDLVAPGEKIKGPTPNQRAEFKDGTSMAAPHVSGAAAMLMARYSELIGQPEKIKKILCETATDLGRERYFQGAGLVDALRALQSV